ncbi:hypothetical protein GOBAR_AA30027 [Gossypium barbadense]|uniref:Uncharacterized protein n=1 Tax=Gossypium barbadense TaxID=3634 RepID=A0A2P5WHV1_GOSBA|nr:hypothetical protein GOBAR_AA30027 [Gossypium barbadense]
MKKTASSFCMCFVPVVSDNGLMIGKGSKKSSSFSLSEVKTLHSPAANVVDSGEKDKDGVGSFGRKNKSGRQSLSRYAKAVFFGTSLLLVLVIWGKVCAIFCTSAVLVFANRLITSIKQGPSDNIAVDHRIPEIGSEQYKKKIIMEGLLERNHIRNLY